VLSLRSSICSDDGPTVQIPVEGNLGTPRSVLPWEALDQDLFLQETLPAMDMVYALARRAVPADEVNDLVQDTFLAAFRAWVDERRPKRVEPWLATICLNLARSRYRERRRRPPELPIEDIDDRLVTADDPADRAVAMVEAEAVRRAMWDLPEEQRIAIALVDLADMSVLDAAAVMGSPKGTVLSRLHRGRRSLARMLAHQREQNP
jgi:RNA polymerase sigma-70 factor (ECF subfamily)